MDPEKPEQPTFLRTSQSDAELLRSATSSPSNTMREIETLFLPEWRSEDAVSWFLQLRKVLKSIVYRYCDAIQKAFAIFEENDATTDAHYITLKEFLPMLWARWKSFIEMKNITTTFLSSSVVFDDFLGPISWMTTPRNVAQQFAKQMAELRSNMRYAANELLANRGLIQDAMARLVETNNGHNVSFFCGLPTPPTTKLELATTTDSEPAALFSDEEDIDSDEELVNAGGIKDHNLLQQNGVDPVWFQEYGYPGTPPPELEEYLSLGSTRTCQIIGSSRSIFWLFGYKDLIELIDDPACVLTDEIVMVPRGIRAAGFLMDYFCNQNKIPLSVVESYQGLRFPRSFRVAPVYQPPDQITSEMATHCIADLYPFSRPQSLPKSVLCLKLKSQKNLSKTIDQVAKQFGKAIDLDKSTVWFCGLSMRALALSMSFFIPIITANNSDNEFGPGIYAADKFEMAAKYAFPNGAVMIFKDPDFQNLNVWRPNVSDWQNLTAHWLQIPLRDLRVPESYKHADVIIGPSSLNQSQAISEKCFTTPGDVTRLVCTSSRACERLAASLTAIIYFTT